MAFTSTKRLAVVGVTLLALTGLLAGCVEDGTGSTGDGGGGSGTGGGAVPDVIDSYADSTYQVTITSVAADKSVERPIQEWFMDEVERRTNNAVTFQRTTANEICAQSDQYSCFQSGAAGLMVQVPNYQPTVFTPSTLPEITFTPEADNAAVLSAAMGDVYANNKDVQAFFDAKGLVPVSTWTVGRMLLGSSVPLEGPDDLQGLTMRTAGTIAAPNLAAAGVVPTQVTADEAYNSFSTGLVKAAAGAMDFVYAWKLGEVLPYWVDPGLGVYSEFSMYWSKDQWDQFPDDIKEVLTDIAAELNDGKAAELYQEGYDSNPMDSSAPAHFIGTNEECAAIQEMSGVQSMIKWSDEEVAKFEELGAKTSDGVLTNDELWVKNATAAGLQNAQGVLDDYRAALKEHSAKYPDFATDAVSSCIESFGK